MSRQSTRRSSKHEQRREQREAQRREEEARQQRAARNKGILLGSVIAAIAVVIIGGIYFYIQGQSNGLGTPFDSAYPNIDNTVACDQLEQTDYHVHVHLSMYINGQNYPLPANIGIGSDCFYWLHVHQETPGIIHIEAPAAHHDFTFGNFLDVWSQQFSQLGYPSQLTSTTGWTVYVNGKLYNGSFRNIPLQAHDLITMMYNSPNAKPDTTYSWGNL